MFIEFKNLIDLVILDVEEFDIILEVSWLPSYTAILYCYDKTVVVPVLEMENLE